MKEEYPEETSSFKLYHRWFEGFCRDCRISLRRKTHATQKSPEALRTAIENFNANSLRERKRGTFTLKELGNMDQTSLSFLMDNNRAYEKTGADEAASQVFLGFFGSLFNLGFK